MAQLLKSKDIHLFNRLGQNLAFVSDDMLLFEVNPLTRAILEQVDGKTPPQLLAALAPQFSPREVGGVMEQLIKLNLLTAPRAAPRAPFTRPQESSEPQAAHEEQETGDSISRMVLYVTQDCNLQCRYCLTRSKGNIKKHTMSETVARAAVDLLFEESKDTTDLTIGFYGGEPLLNFELIQAVTRYADDKAAARGKNVRYNLTTNGTLLSDEVIDFLARHKTAVLMSIDGDREAHDANRVFPDGSGSYDRAAPGFKKLVERGVPVSALSVVRRFDTHQADLARFLLELGSPVVNIAPAMTPEGEPEGEENNDVDEFNRRGEDMIRYLLDNDFLSGERPAMDFSKIFERLESRTPNAAYCTGSYAKIAVDPEGNILPCDNFIGVPEYYMGNVLTGLEKGHQATFKTLRSGNSHTCARCWARNLCGGWCPYFSHNKYGDLSKPVETLCFMNRDYFEVALAAYSALKKRKKKPPEPTPPHHPEVQHGS